VIEEEKAVFVPEDDRVMYIDEQIGRFWRMEKFWRRRIEFERKSWSFERMGSRCEIRTDCGRCISEMHRGEELGLGKGLGGS
jgi:hypothetical protein